MRRLPRGGKTGAAGIGTAVTSSTLQPGDVSLCYCSLLGDCWTKRLNDPAIHPHCVHSSS